MKRLDVRKILREEFQKKWINQFGKRLDRESLSIVAMHFDIKAVQEEVDSILREDPSEITRRYHRTNLRKLSRNFADMLISKFVERDLTGNQLGSLERYMHQSQCLKRDFNSEKKHMHQLQDLKRDFKSKDRCDIYPC